MNREKLQRLYEKSKEQVEQGKAAMQKYANELKEMDKTDLWETAKAHDITIADLKELIRLRDLKKQRLLDSENKKEE